MSRGFELLPRNLLSANRYSLVVLPCGRALLSAMIDLLSAMIDGSYDRLWTMAESGPFFPSKAKTQMSPFLIFAAWTKFVQLVVIIAHLSYTSTCGSDLDVLNMMGLEIFGVHQCVWDVEVLNPDLGSRTREMGK